MKKLHKNRREGEKGLGRNRREGSVERREGRGLGIGLGIRKRDGSCKFNDIPKN